MATADEAGALAAAQYFMGDLYWYMYATGDSTEWAALADDGCIFCSNVLSDVANMVEAGATDVGEAPTFESWRTTTIEDGKRFTATVDAVQPSSERIDSDGQVIDQTEGGRFELHFAIAYGTEWSILAVDATPLEDSAG